MPFSASGADCSMSWWYQLLPPSISVSPRPTRVANAATVDETNAAGTMIHRCRGASSLATRSCNDVAPWKPSASNAATAAGSTSYTTQSCPAFCSLRTMFAPMRPRPIIASCIQSGCHVFRPLSSRPVQPEILARDIAGATAAHQRVLATLEGLTDDQARSPSLLPNWSIGHVLTHLARNADSFVRLLSAAERGGIVEQYEGGAAGRAAAIEAGAGRPGDALVEDLRTSIAS